MSSGNNQQQNSVKDPTKPEGTITITDINTEDVLVEQHINSQTAQLSLPVLERGYYDFNVLFTPDTLSVGGESVQTHNNSEYNLYNVYVKGYDTSITFTPEYDIRGNAYAITIKLTDTQGVLSGETLTLTYPDSSTETFTTDSNGEVYVPLLYVPLSFDDVEVAFTGDTYQEPRTGVYEAWVAHPPYIVGEGVSFMDNAPVIDFRSSDWNKSSNVSLVDGTTLKLGTSGTNKVVVYTAKKLLRGDSISVRVNATNLYHDTYRIGLSSVNSTTSSTVDGGHLASLHRGSSYNRIEEGSGLSVVEACTMRLGSTWKPITFTTDANNRIVVIVDGESHATNTVLPESGAYIYINKTSTSYNMFVDGLVYSYQKRGVTDWTERVDYSGITPHNVSDWRQYNGSSLAVNNTSVDNKLNIPNEHSVVYPVNLGGNFSLSMKLGNNGATTKSYRFGIYGGCPSNPVNNFNTGMLTAIQYDNFNSAIDNWELDNTLKQVDIICDGNSITYKFYNSSGSVVETISIPGISLPEQWSTDCYFALYNGCNANITISDFKVSVEHNINDTRTRNDFMSIEGAPVSNNNLPQTLFSDSNYLKTQSASLLGSNNGERLWLSANSSGRNTVCSKYIVLHRGESVEMSVYVHQNNIDNNANDLWIGLTPNSTTTWNTINSNKIVAFRQYHGGGSVYTGSNQTSTGTPTLGASYKWIKFSSDDDGYITVTVNGTSYTTTARVPEAGAYWFISGNNQPSISGLANIIYHSYGGGAITSPIISTKGIDNNAPLTITDWTVQTGRTPWVNTGNTYLAVYSNSIIGYPYALGRGQKLTIQLYYNQTTTQNWRIGLTRNSTRYDTSDTQYMYLFQNNIRCVSNGDVNFSNRVGDTSSTSGIIVFTVESDGTCKVSLNGETHTTSNTLGSGEYLYPWVVNYNSDYLVLRSMVWEDIE